MLCRSFADSPCVHVLQPHKSMPLCALANSKLSVGVNERSSWGRVMDWHPIEGVYSHLAPRVSRVWIYSYTDGAIIEIE